MENCARAHFISALKVLALAVSGPSASGSFRPILAAKARRSEGRMREWAGPCGYLVGLIALAGGLAKARRSFS